MVNAMKTPWYKAKVTPLKAIVGIVVGVPVMFVVCCGVLAALITLAGGESSSGGDTPVTSPITGLADTPANEGTVTNGQGDTYTVLDRQVSDTPVKVQIELRILVPEDATGERLTRLLNGAYGEVAGEGGFKHSDHPNSISIYAYASEEDWTADPMRWVGYIQKLPDEPEPQVQLAQGRGDTGTSDFVKRVREACAVVKDDCSADDAAHSVVVVQRFKREDDRDYARRELWYGVFFNIDAMYTRLSDLETLTVSGLVGETEVVRVTVDRAGWKRMGIARMNAAIGEDEEKLGERYDRGEVDIEQYDDQETAIYLKHYRKTAALITDKTVTTGWEP